MRCTPLRYHTLCFALLDLLRREQVRCDSAYVRVRHADRGWMEGGDDVKDSSRRRGDLGRSGGRVGS